jgi:hypothetical protein
VSPQGGGPPAAAEPGPLVLAPMGIEWRALRRAVRRGGDRLRVDRCGIALRGFTPPAEPPRAYVTCGLAGGLRADLEPGTVVVASSVVYEGGEPAACDPELTRALVAGARACGAEPVVGPVLTARRLIVGRERHRWAERGWLAAEMETALLASTGVPLGSLRVVIDAAGQDVSGRWEQPVLAALDPRHWREALWLAARAPRYAALAARCVVAGLSPRR